MHPGKLPLMKIPVEQFLNQSLQQHPQGARTARILASALSAVDPGELVRRSVSISGTTLHLQEHKVDLDDHRQVILLGIGKAARSMALATAELLGDRFKSGFLLTKPGGEPLPSRFRERFKEFTGGHPLPSVPGREAAAQILAGVRGLNENDLVIVLISGGGSALFTLPQPDLTIQDLVATNQLLLDCGADIQEINTVRKHLSAGKGGRLAQAINPAKIATLILSDVPGDQLDCVASGPTLPDPTSFGDAARILNHYQLEAELPSAVLQHIEDGSRGRIPETPKPGDPIFKRSITLLIGSNQDALEAAIQKAAQQGFHSGLYPLPLSGEARHTGEGMAAALRELAQSGKPLARPACLIAGGETTVTLARTPQPGKGGRNLELALSAVDPLAELRNCALITLATDGEDGVTDAAGAVVTGESLARAKQAGLLPAEYLRTHNAYPFFDKLGDLLRTGPTGTNVNDLCFLFTYE
jgi:glycerate 2-kinase